MPDHVHLLASLGRQNATADVVRAIKASSSKWIDETFPAQQSFAWQAGYGAFAVSYSQVEQVRGYIANQAAHHSHDQFSRARVPKETRKSLR